MTPTCKHHAGTEIQRVFCGLSVEILRISRKSATQIPERRSSAYTPKPKTPDCSLHRLLTASALRSKPRGGLYKLGSYWDSGKENGNYRIYRDYIFNIGFATETLGRCIPYHGLVIFFCHVQGNFLTSYVLLHSLTFKPPPPLL